MATRRLRRRSMARLSSIKRHRHSAQACNRRICLASRMSLGVTAASRIQSVVRERQCITCPTRVLTCTHLRTGTTRIHHQQGTNTRHPTACRSHTRCTQPIHQPKRMKVTMYHPARLAHVLNRAVSVCRASWTTKLAVIGHRQ